MVGDNYVCDIKGASEAGLKATIWINEAGKSLPEHCSVLPTHVIESVTALPQVLGILEE